MSRKPVTHMLEAAGTWGVYFFFRLLPISWASAIGGWLGRTIGYHFVVSKAARNNLIRAFPDMTKKRREQIIRGVWDNLGRTAAEFPQAGNFLISGPDARIRLEGEEHLEALRASGGAAIFLTAHTGNWELAALSLAQWGIRPLTVIYRSSSNPFVESMFGERRRKMGVFAAPKGAVGARTAVQALKNKAYLGMLVDQKMNEGIAVPFFGRDAMTAPAVAVFALKFKAPVIPIRIIRDSGAHFRAVVEAPLPFPEETDKDKAVFAFMTSVNQVYERWIREIPEQWLWLHHRWPSNS